MPRPIPPAPPVTTATIPRRSENSLMRSSLGADVTNAVTVFHWASIQLAARPAAAYPFLFARAQ